MIVSEYKNLLDKLNKRNYMDFKLKEGESRERLIVRTAKLVQALYLDGWYCLQSVSWEGKPDADWLDSPGMTRVPLPYEVAKSISSQAVQKKRVSKNKLLHGFLAQVFYSGHKTPDQIRGIIEKA